MLEKIVVITIIVLALIGTIRIYYKKWKRLTSPSVGACGHSCDCCPFAKYADLGKDKDGLNQHKGGGCGCGCCGG